MISVGTRLTREGNPSSQSKRLLSEIKYEDLRIDDGIPMSSSSIFSGDGAEA